MQANSNELVVLTGEEIAKVLANKESRILKTVKETYIAHEEGKSSLPHSIFLRFPNRPKDRIIGLPAYVGGDSPVAGMKWIASFPGNTSQGMERASAVIVLNSTETGRPYSILEGSIISAKRTASSAALAASVLSKGKNSSLALVGCGLINFEVFNFVTNLFSEVRDIFLYDLDVRRAEQFAKKVEARGQYKITLCANIKKRLSSHQS